MEIDFVHPDYGVRVVAFSDELVDDNDLDHITLLIDQSGIVEALGADDYQPVVLTNDGARSYQS